MEGPGNLIQQATISAINEWLECDVHNRDAINSYLSRHEFTFVTFGMFIRGMRIRPVHEPILDFHHTPDGMRGIICMNLAILRTKQFEN